MRHIERHGLHAYLDLGLIALLAVAPLVLGFQGFSRTVCWIAAGLLATLCVLTDYRIGVARMLDPLAHHAGEATLGVAYAFVALLELRAGRPAVAALLFTGTLWLIGTAGFELRGLFAPRGRERVLASRERYPVPHLDPHSPPV